MGLKRTFCCYTGQLRRLACASVYMCVDFTQLTGQYVNEFAAFLGLFSIKNGRCQMIRSNLLFKQINRTLFWQ